MSLSQGSLSWTDCIACIWGLNHPIARTMTSFFLFICKLDVDVSRNRLADFICMRKANDTAHVNNSDGNVSHIGRSGLQFLLVCIFSSLKIIFCPMLNISHKSIMTARCSQAKMHMYSLIVLGVTWHRLSTAPSPTPLPKSTTTLYFF